MGKRRGRPPKQGERYACGKLKPTGEPINPVAWQRIRTDVAKLLKDDRLSSEVGRLSFHKELTDEQTAAAFRVGAIYGSFERHKRQRRSIRSPSYEQGFGGSSGIAEELLEPEAMESLELQVRASEEAFLALHEFLTDNYPPDEKQSRRIRDTLERLCVEDRALSAGELDLVRPVLRKLTGFFGTTASKKRRGRRGPRAGKGKMIAHSAANTPAPTPKTEVQRSAIEKAVRVLRPDLSGPHLKKAIELVDALRSRESVPKKATRPSALQKDIAKHAAQLPAPARSDEDRARGQAALSQASERISLAAQTRSDS